MRMIAACLTSLVLVASDVGSQGVRMLPVNGASLAYETAGQGPAVVLIHGWSHSLETWNYLVPALAGRFRVVRYDSRGYGRSTDSPDPTQEPVDLRDLLDSLGIQKAVVLGHSAGGGTALRFAMAFPDRLVGLVLYGAPAPGGFGLRWSGPDAPPPNYLSVAKERGLDAMWQLFQGHPLRNGFVEGSPGFQLDAAMLKAYTGRDIFQPKPPSNATPAPTMAKLTDIRVPTLVLTGSMEMPYFRVVAEALAYAIPNATRAVVPNGGHSVHLQQPQAFNAEIVRFLRSVYP